MHDEFLADAKYMLELPLFIDFTNWLISIEKQLKTLFPGWKDFID